MSDLIDRQAAIELIHTLYPSAPIMRVNRERWKEKYKSYGWDAAIDTITDKVKDLPPAQQERKIGEWIKVDPHIMICPFCKKASSPKNFCADCGADMRRRQQDGT